MSRSVLVAMAALLFVLIGLDQVLAGCGDGVTGLPPEIAGLLKATPGKPAGQCQPTRFGDRLPPGAGAPPPGRTAPPPRPPGALGAVQGPFIDDEVLVLIEGGEDQANALAQSFNLAIVSGRSSGLLGGYFVRLRIPDGRPVPLVLSQLASAGAATAQSPNHLYSLQQGETALPRFALKALALPDTRQRARGKNIRVAVVDTGVDAGHEALAGAILGTFDALPDIPLNQTQHATAIAGLIAGRKEILGVAEGAGLLIARAFDSLGDEQASSRTDALVDAFDWAAGEDAQVVNMSFAGPRNPMLSRVLAKMAERGMILVAAAGNNGPDAAFAYPGAEAGVMAVTATDARNRIYDRANRGRYIFAAAPGVDILAPAAGGGIELVTGTSFAAALMTGIVALLLEAEPGIGSPEISGRLKNSAKDLGPPGPDPIFGAGLANAARALATKN